MKIYLSFRSLLFLAGLLTGTYNWSSLRPSIVMKFGFDF
jgi:hypothetical protein